MNISLTGANSILIISGLIASSKRKEFEQTYRLASSTITRECLFHNLTIDFEKEGHYHFFSLWASETDLNKFTGSVEYQMMNGAFHALGSIEQALTGSLSNIKTFKMNNYLAN